MEGAPRKISPLATKGLRTKAESKAFSTRRRDGTSRLNMDPKIFFGKYSTIDIMFNKIFGPSDWCLGSPQSGPKCQTDWGFAFGDLR